MKSTKFLVLILIIGFFTSCRQADAVPYYGIDFLFKEPQPINDSELNHLPNRFVGNYINNDSTLLVIEGKAIYYKWIDKGKISFSEFDSLKDSVKFVENRMYFFKNDFMEFRKLKDSIEITSIRYDTIFTFSDLQKAKRINNVIALCSKDSVFWKIKVLTLNKKSLNLMTLVSEEDLRRVDSLSKIKVQKIDPTKNIIHLTRNEFKKMLALKRFGFNQEFKKLY